MLHSSLQKKWYLQNHSVPHDLYKYNHNIVTNIFLELLVFDFKERECVRHKLLKCIRESCSYVHGDIVERYSDYKLMYYGIMTMFILILCTILIQPKYWICFSSCGMDT